MSTPDIIGTIPQWITAGSLVGVIVAYWRRGVSLKSLANADEANIRQHYADELGRVVQRQHDCEAREERLRNRVTGLENDVLGLIRIIGQASADKVLELSPNVSVTIQEMADRVRLRAIEDDDPVG